MQYVSAPLSCLPSTDSSSRLEYPGRNIRPALPLDKKNRTVSKSRDRPVNDLIKGAYLVSGCTTDCAEESAEFCAASQAE